MTEEITRGRGTYPLNLAIYGGHDLNTDSDPSWILYLKELQQLGDLWRRSSPLTEEWLWERYWATGSEQTFPEYGEDDRRYTWAYFEEGRSSVFLADPGSRIKLF